MPCEWRPFQTTTRAQLARAIVVVIAWMSAIVTAQSNGAISGVVTDDTSSVLTGVTVTASDLESGREFVGQTDERGDYRLLNMPAGRYSLEASRTGFETVTIPELELLVGQTARVPFTLRVGEVRDSVTVSSESPLVNTTSSAVSGNIDRRQMENLPAAGRNWMELSLQ